ncbi:MAG: peptidyl-prolyl cis-trans isomerase [Spirochaetales bacterium]|nr:peptidyl-prolyl cis-trans isomerase [Spirochaetales bacterium]
MQKKVLPFLALLSLYSCHLNDAVLVNGTPISFERLDFELGRIFSENPGIQDETRKAISMEIIESIVLEELLVQKAASAGISISDQEIDNRISGLSQKNDDGIAPVEKIWGFDESDKILREQIRRQLSGEKLFDYEIRNRIQVPAQETRDYYDNNPDNFIAEEQVHVYQIFFDSTSADTMHRAETLHQKIGNEQEFITAAHGLGCNGYDIGFIKKGQLDPLFDMQIFPLAIHALSPPFRTSFGIHLVFIKDRIEAGILPYEKVKPDIEEFLSEMLFYPEKQKYIEEIKQQSKIVYNKKLFSKLAVFQKKD